MKVLVAPDRFGVELGAAEAADAVALGWARSARYDVLDLLPLSDGGPGFVDVLASALGSAAETGVVTVRGPLGAPVPARVLSAGGTAYVEAAEAVGLHLVDPARPRPAAGVVVRRGRAASLPRRPPVARRVVVGVGGTATTDGGRGLLEALEVCRDTLTGVELVAATATDAPLMGHSGAAHGFAGAKGADRATRDLLEQQLRTWATETDGGLAVRPGAGAGGGIGFGLLLLGAERVNGTALVTGVTGLEERVRAADLAVTALGVFDWESLRGRVVIGRHARGSAGRATDRRAGRPGRGRPARARPRRVSTRRTPPRTCRSATSR